MKRYKNRFKTLLTDKPAIDSCIVVRIAARLLSKRES